MTGASYDRLNRLLSQQPSGPLVVAGTVSEPATVTIQGAAVPVDAANRFSGRADITGGTNLLALTATDASGNTATAQYEIDSAGTARTFTYDANGNMTSDGTRTFEWDARNQLVGVSVGADRSEFTYDGEHRRVRVTEKRNGVTLSDTKAVWCDEQVCEERDAAIETIIRHDFEFGKIVAGLLRFYADDHLGTIASVTNELAETAAQYAFDPWGRRSVIGGFDATEIGFTGHEWNSVGSVWLTQYRAYDSALGRWLSEDPNRMIDGPNLYSYVTNRPTQAIDPFGLQLHLVGPPPSDAPPPGCQATGWTYVSRGLLDRSYKNKWERETDFNPKYQSPRTKMPKGAGSITLGICWVYYKKVGVLEVVRTYELWKRNTTCCGETSTQYARTIQETQRDIPTIDNGRTVRTAVPGVVLNGQCFTARRGPN